MKPRNRYLYLKAALRCVDSAGNPVQPLCLHMICPDAILFFKAKEYRADPFYFLNRRKLIVFPVQTDDYTIIDDCYNANPVSMKSSLLVLADALGRKVAILGDMGELGAKEQELHREVGSYAASLDIDRFLVVGPLAKNIADGILAEYPNADVVCYDSLQEILHDLDGQLQKGDTILVKASHFMHFEKLVEQLTGK